MPSQSSDRRQCLRDRAVRDLFMHAVGRPVIALALAAGLSALIAGPANATTGEWEPIVTLDGPEANLSNVSLVRDGSTMTALWDLRGGGGPLASTSTNAGTSWSAPVRLDEPGRGGEGSTLVRDDSRVTAFWLGYENSGLRLQTASSINDGLSWSAPQTISTSFLNFSPVAVTDGDTITVAWSSTTIGLSTVEVASSVDGGATWTTPRVLSALDGIADNVRVATNGSSVTVVWRDSLDGSIQESHSTDRGENWSAPQLIAAPGSDSGEPVVVTSAGAFTATWRTALTDPQIVVSRSTNGGTTWSAPTPISGPADFVDQPRVAQSGSLIVAAWSSVTAGVSTFRSATSDDGGVTWATPVTIASIPSGVFAFGQVVALDGRNATATWVESQANVVVIVVSQSTDGGQTWSPARVLSDPSTYAARPALAVAGGAATVAWDSAGENVIPAIFARSLSGAAEPSLPELAETGTANVAFPLALGLATLVSGALFVTRRYRVQHQN